ncbi:hypothetical protein G3N58_19570 [Paraburkholderia sp. Ac-20342]|uniref:hypothetical protein n=1 Tax=Paraburkholderia sp. Ac-20342 TaxID=2703889 RepID=UPI00197F2ABE|nr:hypothetical protein [Paraburkholderia sp. Ac-20342]MBN3849002.1 hypothetical protein [Paraburkholderia sp. Ac-20342]
MPIKKQMPPRGVVITYDEANKSICISTVPKDAAIKLTNQELVVPMSITDQGNQLDDEFARTLGLASLLLLALGQPSLSPLTTATQNTQPPPTDN